MGGLYLAFKATASFCSVVAAASLKPSFCSSQIYANDNSIEELAANSFSGLSNLSLINLSNNSLSKFSLNSLAITLDGDQEEEEAMDGGEECFFAHVFNTLENAKVFVQLLDLTRFFLLANSVQAENIIGPSAIFACGFFRLSCPRFVMQNLACVPKKSAKKVATFLLLFTLYSLQVVLWTFTYREILSNAAVKWSGCRG